MIEVTVLSDKPLQASVPPFTCIKGDKGEKGDKGDTGPQGPQGPKGEDGSDANVTEENITTALGYKPVSETTVDNKVVNKLTEPSKGLAVGKYFRVSAIDENGHAVLEAVDAKTVGVQDVKISGSSVVTSGVANMPIATTSKLGVVKVENNGGVSVSSGGIINVRQAIPPSIDARTSSTNPITPVNLDYAVKAAMTDGKGAEWTDEEKQAAQVRMGLSDAVSDVQDANGNSFVTDRVAKIPIAGPGGRIGLTTAATTFGTFMTEGSPFIRVQRAADAQIRDRSTGYCPIVPTNLDYAVKAAMCDGKGAAWTADEQKAARERMSAREELSIAPLADFTLEEDVTVVSLGMLDGLRTASIYVYPPDEATLPVTIYLRGNCITPETSTTTITRDYTQPVVLNRSDFHCRYFITILDGTVRGTSGQCGINYIAGTTSKTSMLIIAEKFDGCMLTANTAIQAGTRIVIYGC